MQLKAKVRKKKKRQHYLTNQENLGVAASPPLPYGFRFAHGFATASRPSRQLTQWKVLKVKNEKWKVKSEKRKVESGKWKVKSEKWKVESGKWKVESEKWKVKSEKWKVESEKWKVKRGKGDVKSEKRERAF